MPLAISKLFKFLKSKPKPKESDLLKIVSKEIVGDMVIVHGVCKKKVTKKDIAPLTKVMEKSLGAEVYVSVDSDDPHNVKFVMVNRG